MRTRVIQEANDTDGSTSPSGPRAATGAGRALLTPIRRHPLVTFFALSYVIAWGALPFHSFNAFGPLLSAVIVIAITDGCAGFLRLGARMIRWRVGLRWYVAAMALPLGTLLVAGGLNVALGAPSPSMDQFTPWYGVLMAFGMNMVFPLGGQLGEEPGWRGFAQPGLQDGRSPLVATSILAVVVTVWHMPLMMEPFGLRPIELLSTVAVTFWYSWLFNHSGGSVLITLFSHSVEGSVETSSLWSGSDGTRLITLLALVAAAVAITLVVTDLRSWRGAAPATATDARSTDGLALGR